MNTQRSLHSAGANPSLEAWRASFLLVYESVHTGSPSGFSERPTVDGAALSLGLYYIYNYGFFKKKITEIASRTQMPV